MQKRHRDSKLYFDEQVYTTQKYVIPFIEQDIPVIPGMKVLEIGCGEGGDLKPFLDRGCLCTGLDINKQKIKAGIDYYAAHPNRSSLQLLAENIYDKEDPGTYDLIFLRDVIEHIPQQATLIARLRRFMHEKTIIFFAFPPWQNPFGGHQQICRSKLLSHTPFLHLLPKNLYRYILKAFGEDTACVQELLEIKQTSITIEQFRKYIAGAELVIRREQFYFINPHYEIKFGLKPRKTWIPLSKLPVLRNFFTTSLYCNVALRELRMES